HQPFADHCANQRHIRRYLQEIREQPPWQRAFAVELTRRGALQLLELPFGPVSARVAPGRLLTLQVFLRLHQPPLARVLGDLCIFLLPAQDLDVVLVSDRIDITTTVELRPPGSAKDLLSRA